MAGIRKGSGDLLHDGTVGKGIGISCCNGIIYQHREHTVAGGVEHIEPECAAFLIAIVKAPQADFCSCQSGIIDHEDIGKGVTSERREIAATAGIHNLLGIDG